MAITNHEEYRVVLERIGQIEDLRKISDSERLELSMLRAAVEDYQALSDCSSKPTASSDLV